MLHAVRIGAEVKQPRIYTVYVDDHGQSLQKEAIEVMAHRIVQKTPERMTATIPIPNELEKLAEIFAITSVEYEGTIQ